MSEEIQILLTALDNASKVIADASNNVKASLGQVDGAATQVQQSQQKAETSTKSLALGLNNAATAGFSLVNSVENIERSQVALDRANLMVKSTQNSLEDATRRYNTVLLDNKSTTEQITAAKDDVTLAEERHQVAVERADMAEKNYTDTEMRFALSVVPTVITGIDGLYKAYKNFPDMSGALAKLSSGIADTGISAKTAAIGVAAFIGGFLVGDTILKAIPENLRGIASALMIGIAAVIAATIAWMALQGTMTMGVAIPIILAAVGAGIAGVKGLIGMAEGGVVASPTVALIGEAGPEVVIPLNKVNNFNLPSQAVTVHTTINFNGPISSDVDLATVRDVVIEAQSEALYRRRGGG